MNCLLLMHLPFVSMEEMNGNPRQFVKQSMHRRHGINIVVAKEGHIALV
jgi:hypothetical protein